MGVNDAVPVSKMTSVFVPLPLHLAPAEHTFQALKNKGPRTRGPGRFDVVPPGRAALAAGAGGAGTAARP